MASTTATKKPVFDILERRKHEFVLWIPGQAAEDPAPSLVIRPFDPSKPTLVNRSATIPLKKSDKQDLWELGPKNIRPALKDGQVYHYWFLISDTSGEGVNGASLGQIQVTDPLAYVVDYRTVTDRLAGDSQVQPAGVVKFRGGRLVPCDVDGREPKLVATVDNKSFADNNHMIIYELPTSWTKAVGSGQTKRDIGTFDDVLALFDKSVAGQNFKAEAVVAQEAVLVELGVNTLELLPIEDSKPIDQWGYATSQYYAPDYDLGTSSDLVRLVEYIHSKNIRFFMDIVMAFGHDPYANIAFNQFHIRPWLDQSNPDSQQCHGEGLRDGWGGKSWRYMQTTKTYDPQSGDVTDVHPSWAFHLGHAHRWMTDFGVDGFRLDSVNNVGNYDFLKAYKDYAWKMYHSRYESPSNAKFLVIGEELSDPVDMVTSRTLDALWNEQFKRKIRSVILGYGADNDDFEWTVRKVINCTLDDKHPFTDGAQSIIYITSHDVGGDGNERLYNFLTKRGITDTSEIQRRAKLAHACLLTAVGIPMMFAGEEFCDVQDEILDSDKKQSDPVEWARKADPWRSELFDYVANLVRFRQECPALGDDDTDFFHVDWDGKIMAWKRGAAGQAPVVVVANFSDSNTPGSEYVVPNWPDQGHDGWREVTQKRSVPSNWVGREPLMRWEVKIYTYWTG